MTPNELSALVDEIADQIADRLAHRPKLVDRNALAEILSVSVPTIDRLRRDGRITPVMVGARVMYCPDSVISELRVKGGDQ